MVVFPNPQQNPLTFPAILFASLIDFRRKTCDSFPFLRTSIQLPMLIATYNLRQGGHPQVHWQTMLEDLQTDILLVQESFIPHRHLPTLLFPTASERAVWQNLPEMAWGSAVYSKYHQPKVITLNDFPGTVVGVELPAPQWSQADCLRVFSIHAPDRNGYQRAVNDILDMIWPLASDCDLVIGGDFNLAISKPAANGSISKADLAIQARLQEQFGLMNCWQTLHPDVEPAQTLRWMRAPQTPYHCDGIFAPAAWRERLVACEVLAGEQWTKLSDHNPVVATFADD